VPEVKISSIRGLSDLVPNDARQVAEIEGWLVRYGSITHMDKELDKNMDLGHEFLVYPPPL